MIDYPGLISRLLVMKTSEYSDFQRATPNPLHWEMISHRLIRCSKIIKFIRWSFTMRNVETKEFCSVTYMCELSATSWFNKYHLYFVRKCWVLVVANFWEQKVKLREQCIYKRRFSNEDIYFFKIVLYCLLSWTFENGVESYCIYIINWTVIMKRNLPLICKYTHTRTVMWEPVENCAENWM